MKLNIIDFQHIYYKYKNMLDMGRMKRLTDENGNDISVKYYVLKEVERISEHGKVDTIVCFESKGNRHKEEDSEYKAQRVKTLGEKDFNNIEDIAETLRKCGYTVLKKDGYEADDLVASAATYYDKGLGAGRYEEILIYTIDNDMLQLIEGSISVMMYRMGKGYTKINAINFDEVSLMFKTEIPFNTVMLYKATVGDKSDNIAGIRGFGNAAFERLISWMKSIKAKFDMMTNAEVVEQVIKTYYDRVVKDAGKCQEALDSLKLVTMDKHVEGVDYEVHDIDIANKNLVFKDLGMNSLIA